LEPYIVTREELEELRKYLTMLKRKNSIRIPYGSDFILPKASWTSLRLCVDIGI